MIKNIPIYKGTLEERFFYIVDTIWVCHTCTDEKQGYLIRTIDSCRYPMPDIAITIEDFNESYKLAGVINIDKIK